MAQTGSLIRNARRAAGMTQAQLAYSLGTTQSAVARLERPDSNPTVQTLEHALEAAGHALRIEADARRFPPLDEGQIVKHLQMTPAERMANFEGSYRNMQDLMRNVRPA